MTSVSDIFIILAMVNSRTYPGTQCSAMILFTVPYLLYQASDIRTPRFQIIFQTPKGVFDLISKLREVTYQTLEGAFQSISKHQKPLWLLKALICNVSTREGFF